MTTPIRIHRTDYRPSTFQIPESRLVFRIHADGRVVVHSRLYIQRNQDATSREADLHLDGEGMELLSLQLNGEALLPERFTLTEKALILRDAPDRFTLETIGSIRPEKNTDLMGLYRSGAMLCTQNEPEGFRRITWFLDRPDVMSVFSVRIEAPAEMYSHLLCNGNLLSEGLLSDASGLPSIRYAEWHDPFPKPTYLFALVAGNFGQIADSFITCSGREVTLRIYTDPGSEKRAWHAMKSLKLAMRWDENAYGREYDLDLFMVVAVDAFNFGAMENKGLNIFNAALVLADPDSETDSGFDRIEAIIAHEYFHNWSGNRVTLRDWFQLTLKEGLTVFREQEFSADQHSRVVKRIQDVNELRTAQFPEDAGPNAHPIRPDSYMEINNFYTSTVYEKGAEIIRMLHTLTAPEKYRQAMDLYFARHDGQAVTCEDFIRTVEDATGLDLSQFRRWYSQAGTPIVRYAGEHDPTENRFTLSVTQHDPSSTDGSKRNPLVIPMALGLIGPDGNDLPLRLAGESHAIQGTRLFALTEASHTFTFEDILAPPVVSAFRGFSAPVQIETQAMDSQLAFQLANDSDLFNRYDAGQTLALRALIQMATADRMPRVPPQILDAFGKAIFNSVLDAAFRAMLAIPPDLIILAAHLPQADYAAAFAAREHFQEALAHTHFDAWAEAYSQRQGDPYSRDPLACANRAFKNTSLHYQTRVSVDGTLALQQFRSADNMTDRFAALQILCDLNLPESAEALATFAHDWAHEFQVMNKWFSVQVATRRGDAQAAVETLARHPLFDARNPNRLRALYSSFAHNLPQFHKADGSGYQRITEAILRIDPINGSVSSSLAKAFRDFARLPQALQAKMEDCLTAMVAERTISAGLREIVENTLRGGSYSPANT